MSKIKRINITLITSAITMLIFLFLFSACRSDCKNLNVLERENKCIEDGIKYMKENDFDLAIDSFRRSIKLDNKNPKAHLYLGQAYYAKFLDECLKSSAPDNHLAQKAEEKFNESIKLDDKSSWAYYSLGNLYYSLNKGDIAIECYEKAIACKEYIDEKPEDAPIIYYTLAKVCENLNKRKKATANYRIFIEEVRKNEDVFLKDSPREIIKFYLEKAAQAIEKLEDKSSFE